MEIYSIIVAALVIILFFIFIRTKTKTSGISQEVLDQLNISKAKAEERADNLKAESDKLQKELDSEREKLSEAMNSLEGSRSYLRAQQEKIDEQKRRSEIIRKNSIKILS